jgi:hypothetical protein
MFADGLELWGGFTDWLLTGLIRFLLVVCMLAQGL